MAFEYMDVAGCSDRGIALATFIALTDNVIRFDLRRPRQQS